MLIFCLQKSEKFLSKFANRDMRKKKEEFVGGQKIKANQVKMNLIHIIWKRWIENQKKY